MEKGDSKNFGASVKSAQDYANHKLMLIYKAVNSIGDWRFGPHAPVGCLQKVARRGERLIIGSGGAARDDEVSRRAAGAGVVGLLKRYSNATNLLSVLKRRPGVVDSSAQKIPALCAILSKISGLSKSSPGAFARYHTAGGVNIESLAPGWAGKQNSSRDSVDRLAERVVGPLGSSMAPIRQRSDALSKQAAGEARWSAVNQLAEDEVRLGIAATQGSGGQLRLEDALSDYFTRQARLPPAGATGFDPRLTPVWAGLKLPV